MNDYQIIQGDALTVLKTLESESVQSVITSPPYYGLRSYKTEPQIWDGDEFCDHSFIQSTAKLLSENRNGKGVSTLGGGSSEYREALHGHEAGESGFCRCGAWRGELGLEPTFQLYISHLLQIFAEVKRVVKKDGCCFVNLGDSYGTNSGNSRQMANGNGGKSKEAVQTRYSNPFVEMPKKLHKSLLNIPHRVFIGMTDELQMIQRNNINWWKRACMPSSAKDRWTVDFESIGFFTKEARYKFNQDLEPAINIGKVVQLGEKSFSRGQAVGLGITPSGNGNADTYTVPDARNARTTWDIAFEPQSDEHYASYPTKLVEKMLLASTDPGDTVFDVFSGTATTGVTALRHRRKYIGIELNPEYIAISERRLKDVQVNLF